MVVVQDKTIKETALEVVHLKDPRRKKPMPKKEVDDFEFLFLAESEKAIKVSESQDGEPSFWLPKSQIEYTIKPGGTVEVTMPIWLASEKKVAGY